jgi:hypothetical protein
MYTIDDRDQVKPISGWPQMSPGAPLPIVLSDDYMTLLAYLVHELDLNWNGRTTRSVGPDSEGELVAILRIVGCTSLMFGMPNDEALSGHPLAARGLRSYGAFEVRHSSWVRALERINSVHPRHRPESYAELHHFVLTFHDSTFECVADRIEVVTTFRGSMNMALQKMVVLLGQ